MKILFLSHYFTPEVNAPAARGYEHCRAWVKSGHKVTVVTCAPNHPFGNTYEGYENKWSIEDQDGIRIIRIKTFLSANKGFFKRTASYISFMLSAIFQCYRFGKHDVVLTTSPQFFNGLAGYFVGKLKRIPWVLEVRDLWPDSILAVGAIRNNFVINCLYRIELFAYKSCRHIVVVTDSFKRYMIEKGVPAEKISVIKNGVDLAFFDNEESEPVLSQEGMRDLLPLKLEDKVVASYVGTHGMAHALETVLDAAELLKDRPHIHFLLVGDGAERDRLLELCQQRQLGNVSMIEQKPKSDMPWIWSRTDISLVHLRKDDLFKSVIPSKIFESMAMGKPIVHGVEGESADMINEAKSGITIEPQNAQELANAVVTLAENKDLNQILGRNGRRYVEENFDRLVLAERFEHILLNIVISGAYEAKEESAVDVTTFIRKEETSNVW